MVVLPILNLAVQALWAHKLRSGLTLLGVIIGVTSVITIVSALEGMQDAIEAEFDSLGPTTFFVQRHGIIMSHQDWLEQMKRKRLEENLVPLLDESCDLCEVISPGVWTMSEVKFGDRSVRNVPVIGTTFNRVDIVDVEVQEGRWHSREDDLYKRRVAFLGHVLYDELFNGQDPVGKDIRIGGRKYQVIGLAKASGSLFGDDNDKQVYIPFSAHRQDFDSERDGIHLAIKARSLARLDDAMDQTRMILRAARHVPFDKPDDFAILTADSILDTLNNATRLFRMGLLGVSMISIVVGGIVVMNIMMVSVTERTREIGIRKAVGAKQTYILLQFLFEALLTTVSGGIIGIVLGFFIARALVGMINMDISPSALAVILGLGISTSVGLIFGLYPAMKAARLDPIKALSYE